MWDTASNNAMHLTSTSPLTNEPAIKLLDFKELCIDSLSWPYSNILVLYAMITFIIMHTVLHAVLLTYCNCGRLFPPRHKNKGNCNFFNLSLTILPFFLIILRKKVGIVRYKLKIADTNSKLQDINSIARYKLNCEI